MAIKNTIEKLETQGKKHGLPKVIKIDLSASCEQDKIIKRSIPEFFNF